MSFPDGLSNTAFCFERYSICGPFVDTSNAWKTTKGYEVRAWGDGAGEDADAECVYITNSTYDTPATPGTLWVETYVQYTFQSNPAPGACLNVNDPTNGTLGASKPGRANRATPHSSMKVLMGDGSVHQASTSVALLTWQAIITPAGNDSPGNW